MKSFIDELRGEKSSSGEISKRIRKALQYGRDRRNLSRLIREDLRIGRGDKVKKGSLQLILAFDTTSSMGKYRKLVREQFDYIVTNLTDMLENIQIAFAGIGEYPDAPYTLQIYKFSDDLSEMKRNIHSIKDTRGGGSCQVSLELLFKELNNWEYGSCPRSLVVVSDQIAHGMDGKEKNPRADYKEEIERLKKKMNFYFVSAIGHYHHGYAKKIQQLQRTLVDHDKFFLDLERIDTLPTLIVGMCLSEVGRLDYMMEHVEVR